MKKKIALLCWFICFFSENLTQAQLPEQQTELLIVGGTESGWAAAIQAARLGVNSITLVLDGEWLGGQYTEQALACVDENKGPGKVGWGVDWHPMKRSFHRSGLFKELMDGIEAFNTQKYGSPMPGRPFHGPSTFRPAEAEAVFRKLLQPYVQSGQVRLITKHYPVKADVNKSSTHPRLTGLWLAPVGSETPDLHFKARLTIDASDWGDVIQVAGAAFEVGADPRSRYGEPSAPLTLDDYPPNEMNPITWAMVVEESDQDTPIPKPARYDDRCFVRTSKLSFAEMKHLDWDRPIKKMGSIPHWPAAGQASPRQLSIFTVRRIVDGYTSKDHKTSILLNYMLGQDYPLERLPQHVCEALEATEPGASTKNIVLMNRQQRQIIFDDAKRHSLCLFYHLQNFVHDRADDQTNSFRHFHLSDEFGTPDHLPPKPYIRESLRLKAMYMMREQDGRNMDGPNKKFARECFSRVMYPDGLFAWQFHYDFHRTGRAYLKSEGNKGAWIDYEKPGRNTSLVSDRSLFPLRSLVPVEMDGLLGAQKNVGYSSIVSAAIRLHDQCIAVGQAAGATAAVSLREKINPREIPFNHQRLEQVRHALCGEPEEGMAVLIWPYRDLAASHPAFVAINRLTARGALPLKIREVDFHPDAPATPEWRQSATERALQTVQTTGLALDLPADLTRGAFCQQLWTAIKDLPVRPYPRLKTGDADGDGIPDADDPSLFTPGDPLQWIPEKLTADQDGLLKKDLSDKARKINFAGKQTPSVSGFEADHGLPFKQKRGFGWLQDLSQNQRQRKRVPEAYRDTFIFTRSHATWECTVPPGKYHVTVCVGDAGHEQTGQWVTVEGKPLMEDQSTVSGAFQEQSRTVDVNDGRLTIEIGKPGGTTNTCLNWVVLEPVVPRD
ncbi:FAD dependent oxidoreductase [Gimesia panareensis]|uniref:FAD dependent oxidoreductase n=1 Tax=Gimesia panareensis TaxID=2527978 RepID=A0A518FT05_9PLAN|nr:FAD-dependent oxidoreductase [Gimesia panareensis]QDV19478.1 FAD dependent oxidoreductase [Gimesia panareensis]